jgi:hypothetical protein
MKYTVQVGSGAMIYISMFHKDWFEHSKVNRKAFRVSVVIS